MSPPLILALYQVDLRLRTRQSGTTPPHRRDKEITGEASPHFSHCHQIAGRTIEIRCQGHRKEKAAKQDGREKVQFQVTTQQLNKQTKITEPTCVFQLALTEDDTRKSGPEQILAVDALNKLY